MIQVLMSKFLLEGLLLFAVSIGFGFLKNRLGKDRAENIREALITAMLWAEEEFGIGEGEKKWEEAWRKLLEILESRNITLRTTETRELQTMMKANINKVNREHYDALLKKEVFYRAEAANSSSDMLEEEKEAR